MPKRSRAACRETPIARPIIAQLRPFARAVRTARSSARSSRTRDSTAWLMSRRSEASSVGSSIDISSASKAARASSAACSNSAVVMAVCFTIPSSACLVRAARHRRGTPPAHLRSHLRGLRESHPESRRRPNPASQPQATKTRLTGTSGWREAKAVGVGRYPREP